MSGYTQPHIMTINDVFCGYDITKLKGKGNIKRKYKCADKKALLRKIFLRYLYIMISDMLDGGKVFVMPSRHFAELKMKRIPDSQFKLARQAGKYSDIDILMSGQKCYEMVLIYKYRGMFREAPMKLSQNFKQQLVDKVNTGYKYC